MTLINTSGKLAVPTHSDLVQADEVLEIITFIDGMLDDNTPYWAYVAVKPSKYGEFIDATAARRPIMLNDYGRVVQYGFDAAVPAAIKEEMKRDYGFDDRYIEKLVKKADDEMISFNKQNEDKRLGDIIAMMKKNKPAS